MRYHGRCERRPARPFSGVLWQCLAWSRLQPGTVALHRIPDFADRGFDTTLIAWATSVDAVCAGAASFTFGILVSRVPGRLLGALGFSFLAIASVMTIYAADDFTMFTSMSVFGLGIGGMMFLQNFIWGGLLRTRVRGRDTRVCHADKPDTRRRPSGQSPATCMITQQLHRSVGVGVGLMVCSALLALITPAPESTSRG